MTSAKLDLKEIDMARGSQERRSRSGMDPTKNKTKQNTHFSYKSGFSNIFQA